MSGTPARTYDGGKVRREGFVAARWDLLPRNKYMWASVQTVRGCPKHCSFCSVWRTDGQEPRTRSSDAVVREVVELRRIGFRFIALADDNFYPVTLNDLAMAERRADPARLQALKAIREERFDLMRRLAQLPDDLVFFTQITMEAAEDVEFLEAMKRARIAGALVGVESVTPEGLKEIYKDFNLAGDALVERLRRFRAHGVHVLGSFIFGLSTDRQATFEATLDLAKKADLTFAQFVTLTPFPGTVDFARWEASLAGREPRVLDVPVTRHWLIPVRAPAEALHPAPDHERRRHPATDPDWCGTASTASARYGVDHGACARCGRAWPSCSSPSCTGRCTPIPASRPIARGPAARRIGPGGWHGRAAACSPRGRCPIWPCRSRARPCLGRSVCRIQQAEAVVLVYPHGEAPASAKTRAIRRGRLSESALAGERIRIATATAVVSDDSGGDREVEDARALHTEPALADRFISYVLARNIRVEADLVDQLFNRSEKRLARALLLLARYGKDEPDFVVPRISQEVLAEMVGTTRSPVNFFMNKFRKLGFIEYNGGLRINRTLLSVVLHD